LEKALVDTARDGGDDDNGGGDGDGELANDEEDGGGGGGELGGSTNESVLFSLIRNRTPKIKLWISRHLPFRSAR